MGSYWAECPKCHKTISFRDENTQWAKWLDEEYERGLEDGRPTIEEKELLEDNLQMAHDMKYLMDKPEVQALLEKEKLDEQKYIRDYLSLIKKEADNARNTSTAPSSPPASAGVDPRA